MHIYVLLGILLSSANARPNPFEERQISLPVTSMTSAVDSISGSETVHMVCQATTTSSESSLQSMTIPSSSQVQVTPGSIQSTDVMTRTQFMTTTQTSFVPISSLVTQSGSIVYYSTWLSVAYSTAVLTSTEYIIGGILTVTATSTETIGVEIIPPMIYECICPSPVMETVYIFATIGPIMTISSAILVPFDSACLDQSTAMATVSLTSVSSASFLPMTTTLSSLVPGIIPTSTENTPLTSSTPASSQAQAAFTVYQNSTVSESSTGLASPPIVSQMPDGQVVIPQMA